MWCSSLCIDLVPCLPSFVVVAYSPTGEVTTTASVSTAAAELGGESKRGPTPLVSPRLIDWARQYRGRAPKLCWMAAPGRPDVGGRGLGHAWAAKLRSSFVPFETARRASFLLRVVLLDPTAPRAGAVTPGARPSIDRLIGPLPGSVGSIEAWDLVVPISNDNEGVDGPSSIIPHHHHHHMAGCLAPAHVHHAHTTPHTPATSTGPFSSIGRPTQARPAPVLLAAAPCRPAPSPTTLRP